MTPMSERIQRALAFAVSEMPTQADQEACGRMVEDMRKEDMGENLIVRTCAAAVIDGLAYGNWPTTHA
jgi:ArsR family metal-binding transcriptional regulator